jgi:PKD repeat protein
MKSTSTPSQLLDERVILTMIICSVLASLVLAFRYKTAKPEYPVNISVKSGPLYTDELILFTAEGTDVKNQSLVWNFGDQSKLNDNNITAIHSYKAPGRYDVSLTINGNRQENKTIYITEAPRHDDPNLLAQFTGPDKATVGEPVTFKDLTSGAREWNWYFGETNSLDAVTAEAKYTFSTPGFKNVTLIVNGKMTGRLKVFVAPKPVVKPSPKPPGEKINFPVHEVPVEVPLPKSSDTVKTSVTTSPVHKAPDIAEEQLTNRLKKVVDGQITAADFGEYMCNLNITVYANGEGKSFNSFCNQLAEIKKSKNLKKLEVIRIDKDPNTNCIKSIIVKYETRGFLGRITH